jgi:cyclophilin family peptidyl-prolyl cis-trans isomerase
MKTLLLIATLLITQNLFADAVPDPTTPPKLQTDATDVKPPTAAEKKAHKKEKSAKDKSAKKENKVSDTAKPVVVVDTSMGKIEIELDGEKAPISTKNFLRYVDEKFYDGTIFHRVIKDFMIQGGGFTKDMSQKPVHEQIKNEAANGLKNTRGTVAMARTSVVDSATAQFFINTVDNGFLNYQSPDPRGFGYAVFGHVTSGMDVVDKIRAVSTTNKSGMGDVPAETVEIKSVRRK